MGYPFETRLKRKSREISFACYFILSCQTVLEFCTEHGNDTAVLCAKLQNNLTIDVDHMNERDFARFQFIRWVSEATAHSSPADVTELRYSRAVG